MVYSILEFCKAEMYGRLHNFRNDQIEEICPQLNLFGLVCTLKPQVRQLNNVEI